MLVCLSNNSFIIIEDCNLTNLYTLLQLYDQTGPGYKVFFKLDYTVIVNLTYLAFLFQFNIRSQTSLIRLTDDSIAITELQYRYARNPMPSTVNLAGSDPNEVQIFIEKLPDFIKGKSGITSCSL